MCGCNSNFDGGLTDAIEEGQFVDFEGNVDEIEEKGAVVGFDGASVEDMSLESDEDFQYLFRSKTKKDCISQAKANGMSGSQARKYCRLVKRGDDVSGDGNCAGLTGKACKDCWKAQGMSSRSAGIKCRLIKKGGSSPQSGSSMPTSGDDFDESYEGEGNVPSQQPQEKLAGMLGGNTALIVGGILVAGIFGVLIVRGLRK